MTDEEFAEHVNDILASFERRERESRQTAAWFIGVSLWVGFAIGYVLGRVIV